MGVVARTVGALALVTPAAVVFLLVAGSVARDLAMLVAHWGAGGVLIFLAFPALVLLLIAIDRG